MKLKINYFKSFFINNFQFNPYAQFKDFLFYLNFLHLLIFVILKLLINQFSHFQIIFLKIKYSYLYDG